MEGMNQKIRDEGKGDDKGAVANKGWREERASGVKQRMA